MLCSKYEFQFILYALTIIYAVSSFLGIESPKSSEIFVLDGDSTTTVVPLKYQISALSSDDSGLFCFDILDIITKESFADNCFPLGNNHLNLNNVLPGSYTLSAYLRIKQNGSSNQVGNVIDGSMVSTDFFVERFSNAVPRLRFIDTNSHQLDYHHNSQQSELVYVCDPILPTTDGGMDMKTATVDIQYAVTPAMLPATKFDACLRITHASTGDLALKLSCFPTSQTALTLQNMPRGTYSVVLALKYTHAAVSLSSLLQDSRVFATVRVVPLSAALPRIRLLSTSATTTTSNANTNGNGNGIDNANIGVGIHSASNTFPTDLRLEFMADSKHGSADVAIPFEIEGLASAVPLVTACFKAVRHNPIHQLHEAAASPGTVEHLRHNHHHHQQQQQQQEQQKQQEMVDEEIDDLILPLTCVPPHHREFYLRALPIGLYTGMISLSHVHNRSVVYPTTSVAINIEVRRQEEFVPSYDWQPLHAWHTIPSGIETRLPVGTGRSTSSNGGTGGGTGCGTGGGGGKEARIPQPWRLQMSMPAPCKYFLRMEMTKSTTVEQIRINAGKQCHKMPHCFLIFAEDELLDPRWTMEHTHFFNRKTKIEYNPACSEE